MGGRCGVAILFYFRGFFGDTDGVGGLSRLMADADDGCAEAQKTRRRRRTEGGRDGWIPGGADPEAEGWVWTGWTLGALAELETWSSWALFLGVGSGS